MAWPSTPISTQHLDADSDSISSARADLKLTVDAVNDLINYGEPAGGSGGVTSVIAGTGISVSSATGDVTITATGGGGGSSGRVAGSLTNGTAVTGTTETISKSVLIPANTFVAGDVVEIYTQWNLVNTNGSYIVHYARQYFNTANSLTGAKKINTWFNDTGNTSTRHLRTRSSVDVVNATNNTRGWNGESGTNVITVHEATGFGHDGVSPGPVTYVINWTVDQYFIMTCTNSSTAGSMTAVGYQIYKR